MLFELLFSFSLKCFVFLIMIVKALCSFVLILFLSSFCFSQSIVNTEKLLKETVEGCGFSAELTGSSLRGNAQMTSLEYSSNLVYKKKKNVLKLLLGGEYIDEEQEVISNSIFGQLRYNYSFNDRNQVFSFYQAQKNKILEFKKRQLFGVGYRKNILQNELDSSRLSKCYISIGVMQEEEILNNEALLKDEIAHTNFTRMISSLVLLYNVTDIITLVNTTYYQPYIKELGDYRVLNETNLLIEINDWLSFNVDLEYRYDSDPPSTLTTKTDFNTNCGIVIEL